MWCGPGSHCSKSRRASDNALADNAPESTATDAIAACSSAGRPCDMVKRAAFAINDILKRHVESNIVACTPGSCCAQKFTDLGDIASSAIDGYDYVNARESKALNKRSDEAEGPTDLINYCDDGTTFCVRKRTADPEVSRHVKRCILCFGGCTPVAEAECHKIQQLHYHMKHDKGVHIEPFTPSEQIGNHPTLKSHPEHSVRPCAFYPGSDCITKRDELTQPGGVADALFEIRDAIQAIKRDAVDDEAELYEPFKNAIALFNNIEDRVDDAVHSIEN